MRKPQPREGPRAHSHAVSTRERSAAGARWRGAALTANACALEVAQSSITQARMARRSLFIISWPRVHELTRKG
jgi:hypothetical protein